MVFNMIISGIGGQGVVSAGTIIAEAAIEDGLSIRNSDSTGLAQRGGSVHSHIKIGDEVTSSIVHPGTADVVLGFEPLEATRFAHMLKPGGVAIVNSDPILPVTAKNGMLKYPLMDELKRVFEERGVKAFWVNGVEMAKMIGNNWTLNSIMLGYTAAKAKLPMSIETLKRCLAAHVPQRTVEVNLKAFDLGFDLGSRNDD